MSFITVTSIHLAEAFILRYIRMQFDLWIIILVCCSLDFQAVCNDCVLLQGPDPKPKLRGDTRTFRVWLDPNQYQQDMTNSIQNGAEDPYETFNIIMRRKPKENNFKVRRVPHIYPCQQAHKKYEKHFCLLQ